MFHIVNRKVPAVLSAVTCAEMGLVRQVHTVTSSSTQVPQQVEATQIGTQDNQANNSAKAQDILQEYSDLFEELGCLPGEHTIKMDPTVPPVVHPPRKVPVTLKFKIKDELDRMEANRLGQQHGHNY